MSEALPPPPPPSTTPAGWYPNGDVQRYWDGSAWTEHTAPLPVTPPPHMQQPQQQQTVTPLRSFTSHIAGRNARVLIYANRVEWERAGAFGSKRRGTETIPIRSITSVTTKRDGMVNWAVSVITAGNTIDMRVSRAEAESVKQLLLSLML